MMRKKILFIEDETELVDLMRKRLETNNYQMVAAYDGEEGLKKVEQEKPDLILLDMILPGINGLELCRRLKADPETKSIPIIIVTASGEEGLPERCLAAGADGLIIKPFEAEEPLGKIRKFIG